MISIYNLNMKDLENYFLENNEKKFKAVQVFEWLYQKKVKSFDEMTNLKNDLREKLKQDFFFGEIKVLKQENDIDVKKFLFELSDKERVEAVLMYHDYGNSLCVSTQVGCNMGCKFCESGRLKKVRNLETYELVLQILKIEELLNERISHIVVMGIGEPFDNYDNLIKFIDIINHNKGLAIGSRHITVSTCGIIPKIKEFMTLPYQVNLAISLHAPTNEIRDKIMPINKVYKLEELISVLKEYIKKTNRRVTFEYVLLKDVNDTLDCAKKLAALVKGMNCYINLIPYNETNNIDFKRSSSIQITKFYDILKQSKINVTTRREFGSKISAACGQLRSVKEDV